MTKQTLGAGPWSLAAAIIAGFCARATAQVEWRKAPLLLNRSWAPMAFDAARGRVVMFGGSIPLNERTDQTWEWDGSTWTLRTPPTSPAPRNGHALAYDSVRRRVVLFGGMGPALPLDETWEWDGTTWTLQAPATRPPARAFHSLAGDSARGRVVLFGGNGSFGDTWEWDGANWTQVAPSGGPPARLYHALAYDSARGRTVLFGGSAPSGADLGDTWEWNGISWVQRAPATSPLARGGHALAFDSVRNVVVLVGGLRGSNPPFADTWEWDGSAWTQRVASQPSAQRWNHALAFDAVRGGTVLFGGITAYPTNGTFPSWPSSTWVWDGQTWSEASPETSPGPRDLPDGNMTALAFDPVHQRVVGFGCNNSSWNAAWSWDGVQWTRWLPATNPPAPRVAYALATDPLRRRVVLFGGVNIRSGGFRSDTWEWDGSTWLPQSPSTSPTGRKSHAMAWHGARSRVVLFGGDANFPLGDTWEWDGSTWTLSSTSVAPSARSGHAMVEDEARGVVVLFGGYTGSGNLNDTWEWDGSTWTFRPVVGPAFPKKYLAYDRARRRVVLTGENATYNWETWEWDGTIWAQRTTTAAPGDGAMAFDPVRNRVVQYSGSYTWEYGPTTPATFTPYGNGCSGSAGTPVLAATDLSLPWIGDTLTLRLTSVPATAPCTVLIGESDTAWGNIRLPFDLGLIGMNGCPLLTPPALQVPVAASGGVVTLGLPIPNVQRFVGSRFYCQGFVVDPPANALGVTVSNGGASRIGGR